PTGRPGSPRWLRAAGSHSICWCGPTSGSSRTRGATRPTRAERLKERGRARCRLGDRHLEPPHRLGHRLPEQIELAQLCHARRHVLDLARAEDVRQEIAGVDEADEHDVAWRRQLVAEQDVEEPALHLLLLAIVDQGVAPGVEHPEDALLLTAHDAALGEPSEPQVLDLVGAPGQALDPEHGVVRLVLGDDLGERAVEDLLARGLRVDDDETLEVVVDLAAHGQVHRDGPRQRIAAALRPHREELARLVVEGEEEDLLGEGQRRFVHASRIAPARAGEKARAGWGLQVWSRLGTAHWLTRPQSARQANAR